MRFSVQLPTEKADAPDLLSLAAIGEMAAAAEKAGFDACFVTDHPVPGERWLNAGGHHTLDPFVALTCAAAATTLLRLQTHVLVLPYRNPFLVAKAAATLDVVSGGRVILGVSAGYLKPEFQALGVDFDERNELTDEAIEVLKRAWSETDVKYAGRHFEAVGNTQLPRPAQQPHPPIWVGGNSRRAIRRAVELADGWIPFPAPASAARHIRTASIETLDDLAERIGYARAYIEKVGRTAPLDIGFIPFGFTMFDRNEVEPKRFHETAESLAKLGVTWMTITLPCATRAEFCERAEAFGEIIRASRKA